MAKSGLRDSLESNQLIQTDDTIEAASDDLGIKWRADGAYSEYVS